VPNQATGWGEVDALASVNAAIAHCADPAVDTPLIRVTRVINLEAQAGASDTQPLRVENIGIGTLDWSLGEAAAACATPGSVDWLSVDVSAGSTPAGGSNPVSVIANAGTLAAGDYAARLCATSNDGDGNTLVDVLVRLVV